MSLQCSRWSRPRESRRRARPWRWRVRSSQRAPGPSSSDTSRREIPYIGLTSSEYPCWYKLRDYNFVLFYILFEGIRRSSLAVTAITLIIIIADTQWNQCWEELYSHIPNSYWHDKEIPLVRHLRETEVFKVWKKKVRWSFCLIYLSNFIGLVGFSQIYYQNKFNFNCTGNVALNVQQNRFF